MLHHYAFFITHYALNYALNCVCKVTHKKSYSQILCSINNRGAKKSLHSLPPSYQ